MYCLQIFSYDSIKHTVRSQKMLPEEINVLSLLNVLSYFFSRKRLNTGKWIIKKQDNYKIITYSMIYWAFLALSDLLFRVKSGKNSPSWHILLMQSQLVWQIMHKRNVSIKRTVCKNCHMTLLKVQYDLKIKVIIN